MEICRCIRPGDGVYKTTRARLAQLDRALPSGGRGHKFESCIARQINQRDFRYLTDIRKSLFCCWGALRFFFDFPMPLMYVNLRL